MSQIGNIYNSYGHEFNIAIANTSSDNLMNAQYLPANTLIVAAEVDTESNEDIGKYSLVVTGYDGVPARLTYCIKEGNGLHYENGCMTLAIDNDTLSENAYGFLSANPELLTYDWSISYIDGRLCIDVEGLPRASANSFGVAKVDGFTIKSDYGVTTVDTSSLDMSADGIPGICIGDGITIVAHGGSLDANVDNFAKCTNSSFGVAKADNASIMSSYGSLSLDLAYFNDLNYPGLANVDMTTMKVSNGVISIDAEGLHKASASTHGTVKLGNEFGINDNGQAFVKDPIEVSSYVSSLENRISSINAELDAIEEEIQNA